MEKVKTYMDRLMGDKEFRERFEQEYQNLCIGEQIVRARHCAHLTQSALAKQIHTTKSAISRYESAGYNRYSIPLLTRIGRPAGRPYKYQILLIENKHYHHLYPGLNLW